MTRKHISQQFLPKPLCAYLILHSLSCSVTDDFTAVADTFTLSGDALIQCIPIAITSDSVDEPREECFKFTISTATSVAGLTLSPSETKICISDSKGKLKCTHHVSLHCWPLHGPFNKYKNVLVCI